MTDQKMTLDFTAASSNLARCGCGSKVLLRYEPGCTFIHCIGEGKTKMALPEWQPRKMVEKWNNKDN